MDRPRRNSRYPRDFKLRVVEACLRGEGDYRALALEHGVRNGAQTRDRAKRRRGGGDDAPVVHPPGRRRKEPAGEEALDRRCARLEMEAGILRRTAASAAALSAAGGSTRRRSRRGGNIRSPRSWSPSGCRAPPIAATRRAPLGQAGDRAAGHSGDMREIPVQIRMPTRCRHVAQSGRHSHRRQDGAQGRARGGAAVPGPQAQEAPLPHGPGRQHRMPARRLALERTGIARPMSRKGSRLDNAKAENFFSMAKTELCHDWEGRPRCLREGSGEACRPVWQRAHQETPGRKRPGRVQAQPGRLIHFFCRSGNRVLCSFGAQLNSIGPFAS